MPDFESDKPTTPHPHHGQGSHQPQAEKTAGDLRAEDAAQEVDQTQAEKQGIQDAADSAALEQYKSEQLAEFPPDSDPLKDREARRAEDKKHEGHKHK